MSDNDTVEKLKKLLENAERDIHFAKKMLSDVELSMKKNYKEVPGVTGIYDGIYLVSDDGQKHEVPANYAAKSRLVFGDGLKMIEEDGKKLFKQITKVDRKRVDAVVNKKEGKWYALAETGSYRLSDVAASFNNLQVNDKIAILIPEGNLNAPFAALDKAPENIKKVEQAKPAVSEQKVDPKPVSRPIEKEKKAVEKKAPAAKPFIRKPISRPAPKPASKPEKDDNKEFVNQIGASGDIALGDDDLR
jgi:hypothetical protein